MAQDEESFSDARGLMQSMLELIGKEYTVTLLTLATALLLLEKLRKEEMWGGAADGGGDTSDDPKCTS